MGGSHLVLFVIVSTVFVLGFTPESFAANANLFVSAENPQLDNYMLLDQVVEVKIIDSDISDTTEAKGEPDVTVNGKILRMVQAEDGNWYGYFAGRDAVIQADSDPDDGLEFGVVCTTQEEITAAENFLNIDVSDSVGITFGATVCDGSGFDSSLQNVLTDFDPIPSVGPFNNGQIGIEPNSWLFIQLYPLNPTGNVVIQYNKGGGAQTTTLTYDDHLPCNNCGGGGGGKLVPPNPDAIPTNNANLFVITGNHKLPTVFGSSVTTIQVIDSDIDDTDEAKGEPDVTVNGKTIRMVQVEDGNWYGYFADLNAVKLADLDGNNEEQGTDYGVFCDRNTQSLGFFVNVRETNGVAIPRSGGLIGFTNGNETLGNCSGSLTDSEILNNVITDPEPINTNPNVLPGQIGLDPLAWPLIQLYSFKEGGNVVVQYNKGGGAQTITLSYTTDDPPPSKDPNEENNDSNGGDNQWDTRPNFGVDHETRSIQQVDYGFGWNGNQLMIDNNHHTEFVKDYINIGVENSFYAKVYAGKGLKVQEFAFGIPVVGEANKAEVRVEVYYDNNLHIEEIKVVQQTNVIDPETISANHERVPCLVTEQETNCDKTSINVTFLEPLMYDVAGIHAIDNTLRDQWTFLNDGFEISGKSLNPMPTKMIPSNIKNQGLVPITQLSKYSPYWQSEDGRMFEMNSFGSFKEINHSFERFTDTGDARTRMHSGFGGILDYEQKRATQVFDSSKLISELHDSFGYHFEMTERFNENLINEMQKQQVIAKKILEEMDKQARNY